MKDALTIVIPTRNRTRYLERLLTYYASTGSPYLIAIGDSSDPEPLERTRELIGRFSGRLRIQHQPRTPRPHLRHGLDGIECVTDLLTQVQTPYAIYMADDDFIVPDAIAKGIHFLEQHPDYSAVNGQAVLVGLKRSGDTFQIAGASDYLQRPFELPTAAARVRDHLLRHGATEFCIKRTPQIRESFQTVVQLDFDNIFEEIYVNCATLIHGKVKKLGALYMVRQGHAQQTSAGNLTLLDWITSPSFHEQYARFLDSLATKLALKDQIALPEAKNIIKEGFWYYLADGLTRHWHHRFVPKHPVRRAEPFRKVWVAARSYVPDQKGRMFLPALLRRSSPYYGDFKPIYELISTSS